VSTVYTWKTGGYVPVAGAVEMSLCTMYEALIEPIREADAAEGNDFLKRFLQRPQERADADRQAIFDLALTDSPITTVDRPAVSALQLLQFLKWIVGWTDERALKAITDRLDEADLRKLITLSVAFWQQRSTEIGLVNAIRLLTGRRALILNWFYYRTIVGETIIGEEQLGYDMWIIGGVVTRFDEYTSTVRLMDDGTLDEQLLLDLIELSRATDERIELVVVDFLDIFDAERTLWNNIAAPVSEIDPVGKWFVIQAGAIEEPIVTVAAATLFTSIVLIQKAQIKFVSDTVVIRFFHQDANNYYELEAGATWILRRVMGGSPTTLSTFAPPAPFLANVWYKIRIQCVRTGTANAIRLYMDGMLAAVFSEVITAPAYGFFRYATGAANTDDILIDNVEFFRAPGRWAIIEPSGTTTGSGFFA